jgi:ParB family chromosome partitioning protein
MSVKNSLKKTGLGRGLSSLMPENPVEAQKEGYVQMDIHKIKPNPYQPRQNLTITSVMELSQSIKEKGVMLPITIVPIKDNDGYYYVAAGERRLNAAKLAGFKEVPAIVKELTDQEMAEVALIENVHRKDLNPIEEGFAFLRLREEFEMDTAEIARKLTKSESYIESKIKLTNLPKLIQDSIALGEISENHGKALLSLDDEQAMIAALKLVIRNGLNAKKTEELVRQIKSESGQAAKSLRPNPTLEWEQKYKYIAEEVSSYFNTDTKLKRNRKNGGSLVINFATEDELVNIYKKLTGKK